MEAENGAWGDDDKEIAYITALNEDVNFRPFFCAFSSKFYAFAYGETAAILGRQSRLYPKCWAGVALLGQAGMTADELAGLQTGETRVPGVMHSQVQMPVWMSAADQGRGVRPHGRLLSCRQSQPGNAGDHRQPQGVAARGRRHESTSIGAP